MVSTRRSSALALAFALAACGDDAGGGDAGASVDLAGADLSGGDLASTPSPGLANKYPGDVGIGADPAVVWAENFEEGSIAAMAMRWDQKRTTGMALVADRPAKSGGAMSLELVAGAGNDAVDLFKDLPAHDELWARWYVKYQSKGAWHHSGMWIGGQNPQTKYPNPQAGLKPDGDDRFSVALEPVWDADTGKGRFDFYNYWSSMHTWMSPLTNDGTSYYGNPLVNRKAFTLDETTWVCVEVHIKLNPDPASSVGAVLEVWKNDELMRRYDDTGPMGYWIRDKFCPMDADGPECTMYPAPFSEKLDLRFRTDANLHITTVWPQNYVTDATTARMQLDDLVLATERVGCLR